MNLKDADFNLLDILKLIRNSRIYFLIIWMQVTNVVFSAIKRNLGILINVFKIFPWRRLKRTKITFFVLNEKFTIALNKFSRNFEQFWDFVLWMSHFARVFMIIGQIHIINTNCFNVCYNFFKPRLLWFTVQTIRMSIGWSEAMSSF